MSRKQSKTLTAAELRVMGVLWDKGEATVRDVTETLMRKHKLAYTTVLTVLRVLTAKGYVAVQTDGRTHVFKPLIDPEEARATALQHMLALFFGGSTDALAQHLIESDTLSAAKLREIEGRLKKGKKRD